MNKEKIKTFLNDFTTKFLNKPGNKLLNECTLEICNNLLDYYSLINVSKKNPCRIKNIPENQIIWVIKDSTGLILSSLYMTYIYTSKKKKILQWSYSYTRNDIKYRRCGLNIALRLASMIWANHNKWDYMNSVPFPDSNSNYILKKMNFQYIDKL